MDSKSFVSPPMFTAISQKSNGKTRMYTPMQNSVRHVDHDLPESKTVSSKSTSKPQCNWLIVGAVLAFVMLVAFSIVIGLTVYKTTKKSVLYTGLPDMNKECQLQLKTMCAYHLYQYPRNCKYTYCGISERKITVKDGILSISRDNDTHIIRVPEMTLCAADKLCKQGKCIQEKKIIESKKQTAESSSFRYPKWTPGVSCIAFGSYSLQRMIMSHFFKDFSLTSFKTPTCHMASPTKSLGVIKLEINCCVGGATGTPAQQCEEVDLNNNVLCITDYESCHVSKTNKMRDVKEMICRFYNEFYDPAADTSKGCQFKCKSNSRMHILPNGTLCNYYGRTIESMCFMGYCVPFKMM